MRDELRVRRVVDRFGADDGIHQLRVMPVDMLDQLGLGARRTGDENGVSAGNRLGNGVEKFLVRGSVPAADGIRLVMDMPCRMLGMQDVTFDIRRTYVKHPRFTVIDPHNRMIMLSHVIFLT